MNVHKLKYLVDSNLEYHKNSDIQTKISMLSDKILQFYTELDKLYIEKKAYEYISGQCDINTFLNSIENSNSGSLVFNIFIILLIFLVVLMAGLAGYYVLGKIKTDRLK